MNKLISACWVLSSMLFFGAYWMSGNTKDLLLSIVIFSAASGLMLFTERKR